MIITNLKGGLGNQMFQYALGRKISLENKCELKLDICGLETANKVGDIYRSFDLDAFNIKNVCATLNEINNLKYPFGLFSKIVRKFRFKILRQTYTGWEPNILNKTGNMYLDGFWQSPKYFNDIREVILKDFSLKLPISASMQLWTNKIQETNSVSIHVRRGDYVSNPRVQNEFGTCSENYYKAAISHLKQNYEDLRFFVFSDDIEWVQRNLELPANTTLVSDKVLTAPEELTLMSKCSHNIIANSSFSWWGAWLNTNPNKVAIAPTPWFNMKDHIYKDLIPNTWIALLRD